MIHKKIADAFNTFFMKITENLDLARCDAISFLKNAFPRKFPHIKIIPTTETDKKYNTFTQNKKLYRL
jgi:hypothetical protein